MQTSVGLTILCFVDIRNFALMLFNLTLIDMIPSDESVAKRFWERTFFKAIS